MITKFSNLEDFFSFLELKRAEIAKEFVENAELDSKDFSNSQISESLLEMTTEELKEVEITGDNKWQEAQEFYKAQEVQETHNEHIVQIAKDTSEDSYYEIINDSVILQQDETENENNNLLNFSQESSIESDIIQMAWSTSLETPLKSANKDTDTTLIMEQLNLNFDDCIDDDLMDFEEQQQEGFSFDPLGLDSLAFPISQFPNEEEIGDESDGSDESKDALDEIISMFDEEIKSIEGTTESSDEFDFDIPMSQFPSTQAAIQSPPHPKELILGFTTGRGVKLPPPSEAAFKKAAQLTEEPESEEFSFFGFKTGRGKELPAPSQEAMKRARSLVELDEKENNSIGELPMFTTGSGKIMPPPSEEGMKRAKSLIEEGDTSENTMLPVGFSTGRGKVLPPPSKEALTRASKLFDSFDDTTTISPPVTGFRNGRGAALPPPSEEALAKASKLIANFDDTPLPASSTNFGLSTGKGKTLSPPSDAAMKKATSLNSTKKPLVPGNTAFKPPSLIKTESKPPPKPFSLSNAWKRPRNLATKPATTTNATTTTAAAVKVEPAKLFDLNTDGMQRFKLKDFFKSTPNLNISDYSSYGIPENILKISSRDAKYFKFSDGWGFKEAHQSLIENGAQAVSISLDWTSNHYRWIIWKFASILRCFPEKYSIANLSPGWVLQQLLYRYEREIHLCNRSALKKIIERDDAAGKYLCLMVAGIDEESKALELSDGWYSIWTCKLESPFWDLVSNKKIFEGMKIEISGASLTGQDGIPALEASSKDCQCRLIISRNSCRPARWDTKLGFIKAVGFFKHLYQIHPQGGPVPAISLFIDRVYPLLFREDSISDSHVVRNEKDHYLYLESNTEQAINSKFTPIQRIKVLGNCETGSSIALISFWNPLGEDQKALLQEGSTVIITNLRANSKTSKLSLVSTKSTRIFKDENKKIKQTISSIVKIDLENYFLLSNLKLNEFYDVQGIALGRVGTFFWIGGVQRKACFSMTDTDTSTTAYTNHFTGDDSTCFLICLKNFNYNFNRGEIINFRDLTFNHFDNREGVAHFTFTEYSDFKKDPTKISSELIKPSIQRFKDLTK